MWSAASSTSPPEWSSPHSPASLLPDLRHEGNLGWAAAGFTAGVALVLSLAAYGRRLDNQQDSTAKESTKKAVVAGIPIGFLATVAIDLLIDGVLVGLGTRLGSTQALILTIALTLEILFLSLSMAAESTDRGLSPRQASLICSGLGVSTAVGAITAAALLGGVGPAALAFVLAFGAAALLYLAVEELLVEAHEQTETALLSAMFFAGFLAIYVLAELGG
ncbi:hypothetical protein [Nocardioides convexus]|uniref:ZIP family metal transporter n=1 Tax=Nocardioides convexus TaxID=2712224 RepID=UPI0024183DD4|nr:hypothetical protein [Nocardioides convexus]